MTQELRLRQRLFQLFANISYDGPWESWSHIIMSQYQLPERHYHTLAHIEHMLRWLDKFLAATGSTIPVPSKATIELAIWFHDIFYVPQSNQNELESVTYFKGFATCSLSPTEADLLDISTCSLSPLEVELVDKMIMSTVKHESLVSPNERGYLETQLFLDLDLSILASEKWQYDEYARNIRKEYAHLSDTDYATERRQVLKQLLSKENMFHFGDFFDEKRARENLNNELLELGETTS